MKPYLVYLIIGIFLCLSTKPLHAATYYSIQNGPWTSSSTWSLTSGGSAISSSYPSAGDNVIIEGGFTVTIAASGVENLAAANITIGGSNTSGTLSYPNWNATSTLTVSGDIIIGGSGVSAGGTLYYGSWGLTITCSRLLKGTGSANRINPLQQDFTFTGTFTLPAQFNEFRNFIINGGIVTLSADIETNGSVSPSISNGSTLDLQTYIMTIGGYGNFVIDGTLIVKGNSGGFNNSNFPSTFTNLTIGNNSTVVYSYPGNQTIYPTVYNNLVLGGSGTKTTGQVGFISGLTLTNEGSGYTCGASVDFIGGGGSGASAEAQSWGSPGDPIDYLSLDNGGSGYTSAPTVIISGYCGGSDATATADMTILTEATVNGKLTMQGSAVLAGPQIIYGANSALEYAGLVAQTTGIEFPSNWSGSGGIIINNNNGVTLNSSRTISSSLFLTNGVLNTTGANLLTISNTSSSAINGGSAISFINGPVKITLPASLGAGLVYTLPIGKSSTYLPFVLNNPTTSTGIITVTAEAFITNSGGSAGAGILSISNSEYWALATSGNFTGSSVSLTRPTSLGAINVIGQSNTVNGVYNSLDGTVNGTSLINSNNINAVSQSYFVFASNNAMLPLKIASVSVVAQQSGVEVKWTTYAEMGIVKFEIEKSADGQHFYYAGSVLAKGNNYSSTDYNWNDKNIKTADNYYRVKSIGIDGEVVYSQIVRIISEKVQSDIILYPNPVKDNNIYFQFINREKGNYIVTINNTAGQLVFAKTIIHSGGSAVYNIRSANLFEAGIYHLRISGNKFHQVRTVLKR